MIHGPNACSFDNEKKAKALSLIMLIHRFRVLNAVKTAIIEHLFN